MTEILDPVRTSAEIIASYRRYLGSLIASRDPKVGAALTRAIDESPMLDRGPYLEATPPYAPGSTLQELIDEGVLSPGFADLASPALPLRRPLYRHQEASIRKVRDGRNVVVATGTGSGSPLSVRSPAGTNSWSPRPRARRRTRSATRISSPPASAPTPGESP